MVEMDRVAGIGDDARLDDLALSRRMLGGDRQAFEEFFGGNFPRLYRFALLRVNLDEDLARELAQTAICKAIENLAGFRGEASLSSWLFTICHHEIDTWRRKNPRRQIEPLTTAKGVDLSEVAKELASTDRSPEHELQRRELEVLVHHTLDQLPEHYRRILGWKYFEGLPVLEIGRRLELGIKAVESLLTRARRAFRVTFQGHTRRAEIHQFAKIRRAGS